jgi:hypothetical protein
LFTEVAAYSQAANADYLPPNSGNEKINGPASRMEQELNQTREPVRRRTQVNETKWRQKTKADRSVEKTLADSPLISRFNPNGADLKWSIYKATN